MGFSECAWAVMTSATVAEVGGIRGSSPPPPRERESLQGVSSSEALGVVDVVGRLADPALRLLQGVAVAVVEAPAVELALPGVVAGHQLRPAYLVVVRDEVQQPIGRLTR